MNTKDITQRQLEVLAVLRSLEETVSSKELKNAEGDIIDNVQDAVVLFAERIDYADDYSDFIRDICKLSENGYIVSDASDEDVEFGTVPEIEGITPKGKSALDEFETGVKKEIASGKKIVLFQDCSLFKVNASLLGGLEITNKIFDTVDSLFKIVGKVMR